MKRIKWLFRLMLGSIVLISVLSCNDYEKEIRGKNEYVTFNECSINIPDTWYFSTSKHLEIYDNIWLFKNKMELPWIDITITKDKPERDLGMEVVYSGRMKLMEMIRQDPKNDYSVGGSGKDEVLWDRNCMVAEFIITDNKKIEPTFKYKYIGTRIEKKNIVVFIGITFENKDEVEIDEIMKSLKIKDE